LTWKQVIFHQNHLKELGKGWVGGVMPGFGIDRKLVPLTGRATAFASIKGGHMVIAKRECGPCRGRDLQGRGTVQ